MILNTEPMNEKDIYSILKEKTDKDMSFKNGKIVGSMCTSPQEDIIKILSENIDINIGDPGLFKGSVEIEEEAISIIGNMLHNEKACGVFTTGGTEANILAMLTAKKLAKEYQREVIVPKSAHFSFDKAALLMDFKLIKIDLNPDFTVNIEKVRKAVNKNTMAIVGIAGSTGVGAIDDIEALNKISIENNIYLHIDAAFGGFVLPFLKAAGYGHYPFDFTFEGVKSITIDPHKMGRGVTPGGCIIFRDSNISKFSNFNVSYLAGGNTNNKTIVGTRSGGAVLANWYVMKLLGKKGYIDNVKYTMDLTFYLYSKILKIEEIDCVKKPNINIIAIKPNFCNIEVFLKALQDKGWAIANFNDYLRIVIMPHITKDILDNFLNDILMAISEIKEYI